MPSKEDLEFGEIAASRRMLKPDHVKVCLQIQADEEQAGQAPRTLSAIMVKGGYLTQAQADLILETVRENARLQMVGKYKIVGKLGEGGMGVVYKALAPGTGATVALKVLSKTYANNPAYVIRFRQEASAGLQLNHPSIVRTLDVGASKGVLFIVLELVEGGDLDGRIKKRGVIPEVEALEMIRSLALGLQHAYATGLVHRDIKPANILFDAAGQPKISDFGLVKMTDWDAPESTQAGTTVGTPHYIAPEQIRGERDIDVRADIYALGVTFFRMVTGKRPFDGPTTRDIITKHLTEPVVSPATLNPKIGAGCAAIIQKMMAKDRADRYAQPSDLVDDIELVLAGKNPTFAEMTDAASDIQRQPAEDPAGAWIETQAISTKELKAKPTSKLLAFIGIAVVIVILAAAYVLVKK